ncbi:MAG: hypothetical protein KUG77_27975 [Nannocystaceae bacterium]|nr:hypothetical protein [Nannocystaceae bacterium]
MGFRCLRWTCVLALSFTACGDDSSGEEPKGTSATSAPSNTSGESTAGDSSAQTGVADGSGTDTSVDDDGQYLVFSRIQSPAERTMYASVVPSLDHGTVDLGQALEFSGFSRVRPFGGKLYAFDGETGAITRYVVADDGAMSVDLLGDGANATVSFAGLGVTFFLNSNRFIDESRALYFDVGLDVVVEWNPTEMTITGTYELGTAREGFDAANGSISVVDNHVIMPLYWSSGFAGIGELVVAAVTLDLNDPSSIQVIEDDRCAGSSSSFVHDGAIFVLGDNFDGLGVTVSEDPLPSPCLLRWTPGASSFDADYEMNVAERVGSEVLAGAVALGDGTFMTQVYTSDVDPTTLGPFEILDSDSWERALVSLEGDEVTMLDTGGPTVVSSRGWVIDGAYTFPRTDQAAGEASLLVLDGTTASPTLDVAGEIFHAQRIR